MKYMVTFFSGLLIDVSLLQASQPTHLLITSLCDDVAALYDVDLIVPLSRSDFLALYSTDC